MVKHVFLIHIKFDIYYTILYLLIYRKIYIFITFAIIINFFYLQQIKLILVFYKFEFISFAKIIKIRNAKTIKKKILIV